MESITLQQVLPDAFAGNPEPPKSDLWLHDVTFRKGEYYLVEAASGTGKSSLCSFLYGARTDYAGRILFDAADCRTLSVAQWGELRRKRDTPAGKLSFGQQQRVAFIRCLCQPFDFILLDEPVSHLDAANGEVLSALLLEGAQAQGAGVIVTSVGSRLRLPYHKIFTL